MKIPSKLKIGGHEYEVRLVKTTAKHLIHDADGITTNVKKCVIEINETLDPTEIGATLLHEIMHATNSQWGVSETMHALLEATAQQLYQVLHDNKLQF